jgi:hypothetical protein
MDKHHTHVATEEVFSLIDKGEIPLHSLFKQASHFSQFYMTKENRPQVLNFGLIYLEDFWQKKMVSWLNSLDDTELRDTYLLEKMHHRFIPTYGESPENVLHLAISYGKIDTTQYFIEKAHASFPKLLTEGHIEHDCLLQMAICSQKNDVFDYVLNHLTHDFNYQNHEGKNILDYAYLYFPHCLEKLMPHYEKSYFIEYFENQQTFYDSIKESDEKYNWHHLNNFKKNESTVKSIIEKIQLEKIVDRGKKQGQNIHNNKI